MAVELSIRERLLQRCVANVQGIRKANGRNTDVKTVNRLQTGPFLAPQLPGVSIYDVADDPLPFAQGSLGLEERLLTVVCEGWLKQGRPEQLSSEINGLLDDLYVVMMADAQQGGLSIDTWYDQARVTLAEGDALLGGIQAQFVLRYRFVFKDPTSPSG